VKHTLPPLPCGVAALEPENLRTAVIARAPAAADAVPG